MWEMPKGFLETMESGSSHEKINALEQVNDTTDREIIGAIVARLGDADIRVRGEAFSSLLANKNDICSVLVEYLDSTNADIRGFMALILANRGERSTIPHIEKLADDLHAIVRSCAVGALGHLKAHESRDIIVKSMRDADREVRMGAIWAAIKLGMQITEEMLTEDAGQNEPEINAMLTHMQKLPQ